ncbi:MAG: hypothetical protein M1833_007388 [Piccolia ochrophora]|nr:MAG: hypothetical protein M1833_007388 [Piccolia ochrophora]
MADTAVEPAVSQSTTVLEKVDADVTQDGETTKRVDLKENVSQVPEEDQGRMKFSWTSPSIADPTQLLMATHEQTSGDFRSRKLNNKFDPSSLKTSKDPDEIRKQVEFYFSDSNLPADKYLLSLVGGTKNHPIPIVLLHNFKRMRHFQPYEAVVAALKDSKALEVDENELVKRKTPIDESLLAESIDEAKKRMDEKALNRSIYAKGFGEENPTTQLDIEAFFAPYGPVNAIRLRRTTFQLFKGSVFVEFPDEAAQQAFLALETKPKWKDTELLWKSRKDYHEGKAAEYKAGRIKPRDKWNNDNRHDPNDWKKRREEDQKSGFRGGQRGSRSRGRGRGGRGRRNDDRGDRDNEHDRSIPKIKTSTPESAGEVPPAKATSTAPETKPPTAPQGRKRSRDDTADEAESRKKIDNKPDSKGDAQAPEAPQGRKRSRDETADAHEDEGSRKKIDNKPDPSADGPSHDAGSGKVLTDSIWSEKS